MKQEQRPNAPQLATIKIFKHILEYGPITAYEITNVKGLEISQPNVFRIIKRLKERDFVVPSTADSPRKKKFYAPTIHGFFSACCHYDDIMEKFDYYYNRWAGNKLFENSLKLLIIDFDDKTPKQREKILKYYLDFVRKCLALFYAHKNKLPVEFEILVGEMLMAYIQPEKTKEYAERLYESIIPFRENFDHVRHGSQEDFHDALKDDTGSKVDKMVATSPEKIGKHLEKTKKF